MSEDRFTEHERAIIRQTLRAFKLWWNAPHRSNTEEMALDTLIDTIDEGRAYGNLT